MNRKSLIIIGLQTLIIVVLFWVLVFYGKDEYEAATRDDEETISSPSHVTTENGAATISLSVESQQQSGIATSQLRAAQHQGEVSSFGQVIAIDSLIEQRARYLAAIAELGVIKANLANSRQEAERLTALNRDNRNVSDRAAAAALTAQKTDEARLQAAETTVATVFDGIRQQWGDVLANWAIQQTPGPELQQLLQRQEVLLQVMLPLESAEPEKSALLHIITFSGTSNSPKDDTTAKFVSAAPQTDSTVQGKTFYYRAPAHHLRSGMRISARLATQAHSTSGVILPASSIVWYANQPWVYQKQGAEKFVRRPVSTDIETSDGWFDASSLKAGDEVVTTGAQLLLSEEFKYQIKNENED